MGKKGYNWKAREVVKTVIDDTKTKKIQLELNDKNNYDECNALVLPSQKRKTKTKRPEQQITRILSKKQRKHLEKIVEKKTKKENRATLLENLSKVQATSDELNQLTSIASLQTKGLKKYFHEQNTEQRPKRQREEVEVDTVINSVAGSKKLRVSLTQNETETKNTNDPNIVGFEESDNSDGETFQEDLKPEKVDVDIEIVENKPKIINSDAETVQKVDVEVAENIENNVKSIENKLKVIKPAVFIPVSRSKTIQSSRLKLPILAEEQQIMETIQEHPVVLIAGETGSGKTTQIPQFLYEAGFAQEKLIGVTEPRRVAAIAMSKRVGEEMNLENKVSYLIRFEGNVTDDTEIKFMTDGVLLKEIQSDFLLTKYSVIILDEAHERSVYTDILIGLLSRIVPLRNKRNNPLKLIIMSATLRLADFTDNSRLFKTVPPVLKIDARQFPVTIHFNKRTPDDYVQEAFNKCVKIHTKLPDGAILVFVTGQNEVNRLVYKLRKVFPIKNKNKRLEKPTSNQETDSSDGELEENLKKTLRNKNKKNFELPDINLDDYGMPEDQDDDIETNDDLDSDDNISVCKNSQPLWTVPLYSLLPNKKQAKVFEPPPIGCRLCVVSTNVAETSLTIPGVKYVVDTGKAKQKVYDKVTGVSSYHVDWTSKASADQRSGRAGRTGPGHCYRLFSSAVFQSFQQFSIPEIRQKPVDDLYLQMRCMNIDKIVNFPFPTAPDLLQLKMAENRLEILGALKDKTVTDLGKAISRFPVLPRFGKMLALSHQHELLPYTICIVAALSVQEVLLETPLTFQNADQAKSLRHRWIQLRRKWAGLGNSLLLGDPLVLLKAVGAAEYANTDNKLEQFCEENGLRHKAITEIRKLRLQLTNEIKLNVPDCEIIVNPKLEPPTELQAKLLRQILLSGMGDQVAKRISPDEFKNTEDKIKYKYAYRAMDMEQPVFIHTNSVLKKSLPDFVIYQELYETNKLYMRGVTAIEPNWLPTYVPHLCNLSEPLLDPEPRYDPNSDKIYCTVTGTFGKQAWELPPVEIQFPKTIQHYKWFATFLLQGQIFNKLENYAQILLSPPKTMVKTWAKLQSRTDVLLKTLIAKDVCEKKVLENIWQTQPTFLLQEYKKWLPESAHIEISLIWPPL